MTTPTENSEIVVAEPQRIVTISTGASIEEMVRRRELIAELMRRVLKEGEHYGTIPGAGDKNTLLLPGAQKVGGMFNLAPEIIKEDIIDLGDGHREYRLTVGALHYPTGKIVGHGVGSCSTMETKYRYRNVSDFEVLEQKIPHDYKEKKNEYRQKGFGAKKVDGIWAWVKYGDESKVANPDIADVWNTVYKMAQKRAYVNAILYATGASDFFTQDLEERDGNGGKAETGKQPEKPATAPTAQKKAPPVHPEVWEEKLIDVEEEEKNGRMVYTARFETGRGASTLKQELANKAYQGMKADPERVFKASVKPGRFPNTYELLEIE